MCTKKLEINKKKLKRKEKKRKEYIQLEQKNCDRSYSLLIIRIRNNYFKM